MKDIRELAEHALAKPWPYSTNETDALARFALAVLDALDQNADLDPFSSGVIEGLIKRNMEARK
jgi:hypothetical protein